MNNHKTENENDSYKSLLLLEEISKGDIVTQRDLSKSLGIALGLINSYLKNLISKGYITVTAIPRKRYKYYLTPKGFAEKTRLTYHHLQNFTNLYKTARRDFQELFHGLEKEGVKEVIFCGVDEVAEIAYLSLRELDIKLIAVLDDERRNEKFFEHAVFPLDGIGDSEKEPIILTKFHDEVLYQRLLNIGVSRERIYRRGGSKS